MNLRTRPLRSLRTCVLGLLLAVPGTAVAQGGALGAADTNRDGSVDRREFHQRMVDVFYLHDSNRDGRLTPDELPGVDSGAFARSDVNRDGGLQLAEFLDARARDFSRADRNGDGSLDGTEADAYE